MARAGGAPENLRPPFSSTNQPANRGRKPSSVKKFIKDNGLNYNDVSAMAKAILPMRKEELYKLLSDDKTPFIMRLFAKSVLNDFKKGNLANITSLIDRAVGKPKEIQEIYTPSAGIPETKEEREARIEELLSKREKSEADNS